jgi:hypothetical protein
VGTDTFTNETYGVDNGGITLESGPVIVTANLLPGGTPLPPTWSLLLLGIMSLGIFETLRRIGRTPQR